MNFGLEVIFFYIFYILFLYKVYFLLSNEPSFWICSRDSGIDLVIYVRPLSLPIVLKKYDFFKIFFYYLYDFFHFYFIFSYSDIYNCKYYYYYFYKVYCSDIFYTFYLNSSYNKPSSFIYIFYFLSDKDNTYVAY